MARALFILGVVLLFNQAIIQARLLLPNSKPGKCPDTSGIITHCGHFFPGCSSDYHCPGNHKCCPYGCQSKCMAPVPKCGPICKMYCQFGFVHENGCPICKCKANPCSFVDCLPDHRCVVVKQRAKCVAVLPFGSRCPKSTGPGLCTELCGSECRGGQILICLDCVVPTKPANLCPKPSGFGVCANLCGLGCTGGKICCPNGCGHHCINPVKG